ncbi:peptidoglycan-binding protein [Scytonema hofmannii FACHB-248]|uniref:Peptidoglycan-binding protein n=1 Tax=Scytonema hofmannii FACHB-248 TaxID=1842502 RepID=A0ABR8GT79_9CYAN|nr:MULTISPECIES: peptidoglycan-binding protein [Nostocales]MBD2606558.1 peptidoglycan-binding protein [Scytonema hofmannii FACHB-248]
MENLAYLHLAFVYEESPSSELVSLSSLLNKAAAPDWKRLSSKAWGYMLPLAVTLSVLSVVSSALALERGDQGPSVRNLQQKLQKTGFYQAPVSQVFDFPTEDAVRRFQKSAGLPIDGVANATTLQKLDSWRAPSVGRQANKPVVVNTQTEAKKPTQNTEVKKPQTTEAKKPTQTTVATKRSNPNLLARGDEGEEVRVLQERLRVAGYYKGNSTGVFGSITEEGVKRFQQAYKLDADGIVGPETERKLPVSGIGNGEDTAKGRNDGQLKIGDRGEAVRVVQEQLIKAGYLEGKPNGYYGPNTTDAVRRFQTANYLASSGVAGPTTRAKLYSLVTSGTKNEFNVLEIQRRLHERGFYKGTLNGVMGNDTKKAIRQAQLFYGISLNDVKSGRY